MVICVILGLHEKIGEVEFNLYVNKCLMEIRSVFLESITLFLYEKKSY